MFAREVLTGVESSRTTEKCRDSWRVSELIIGLLM